MRKIFVLCFISILLFACPIIKKTDNKKALAEIMVGGAEYVSVENAPIIDGAKDVVWKGANGIAISTGETVSGTEFTSGKVTILWNETGLYFLGEITDTTVNDSDICNLWVSETYFASENDDVYPNVSGAYYLCLNPKGENVHYQPDSWEKGLEWHVEYQIAGKQTSSGYTVEAYIPLTGTKALVLNEYIGFDVSVDSYLEEGAERDDYVNWNGEGWYWQKPSCLGKVQLLDMEEWNGVAPKNEIDKDVNDVQTPPSQEENQESQAPKEDEGGQSQQSEEKNLYEKLIGCYSGVSSISVVGTATILAAIALTKNKKNRK